MSKNVKIRILGLIKTHISYLAFIIFVIGLNLKYSFPSIFPLLNKFDIKYFGSIFVEFGVLLFVGNWLIDKYKEEVNRKLFSDILDKRIGFKGTSLLIELVNLMNPFSYNVVSHDITCYIKKLSNSKKYDMTQSMVLFLQPQQDNVFYSFGLGDTEEGKKPNLNYIKLNGKNVLSQDIKPTQSSSLPGVRGTNYQISIPLKKGKEYKIEINTTYPSCMSDLNDNEESDYHEYEYRQLTEKTFIRHIYSFSNFKEYEFKAEKRYLTTPDIVELPYKINIKKREITVEAGNLKNGDKIYIVYTKKKI